MEVRFAVMAIIARRVGAIDLPEYVHPTRVPCPASSPPGGGLSFAGRRAALGSAPAAARPQTY